ncbi:MAG: hypothetical protein LUG23_05750 [Oscillospiraceae bacterium]|nr:hypothetical protein [Oscillospiraceae bacterium]
MHTTLKKYNVAFTTTTSENKKLRKKNEQLTQSLEKSSKESVLKKLEDERLRHQYLEAVEILERIPAEVVRAYTRKPDAQHRKTGLER